MISFLKIEHSATDMSVVYNTVQVILVCPYAVPFANTKQCDKLFTMSILEKKGKQLTSYYAKVGSYLKHPFQWEHNSYCYCLLHFCVHYDGAAPRNSPYEEVSQRQAKMKTDMESALVYLTVITKTNITLSSTCPLCDVSYSTVLGKLV